MSASRVSAEREVEGAQGVRRCVRAAMSCWTEWWDIALRAAGFSEICLLLWRPNRATARGRPCGQGRFGRARWLSSQDPGLFLQYCEYEEQLPGGHVSAVRGRSHLEPKRAFIEHLERERDSAKGLWARGAGGTGCGG